MLAAAGLRSHSPVKSKKCSCYTKHHLIDVTTLTQHHECRAVNLHQRQLGWPLPPLLRSELLALPLLLVGCCTRVL